MRFFFPVPERLRLQRRNLEDELRFLCEKEAALEELLRTLEERLEAHELVRSPFQQTPLEWSASPGKILDLYHK